MTERQPYDDAWIAMMDRDDATALLLRSWLTPTSHRQMGSLGCRRVSHGVTWHLYDVIPRRDLCGANNELHVRRAVEGGPCERTTVSCAVNFRM